MPRASAGATTVINLEVVTRFKASEATPETLNAGESQCEDVRHESSATSRAD
jgi:hypothetical protein